ncbi:hypothetical protein F5H01DRAFT_117216 [Linnemannia elongata]|nr:hypothetical protein F5H01DRAFT_117216 [Linnemannia elongata]
MNCMLGLFFFFFFAFEFASSFVYPSVIAVAAQAVVYFCCVLVFVCRGGAVRRGLFRLLGCLIREKALLMRRSPDVPPFLSLSPIPSTPLPLSLSLSLSLSRTSSRINEKDPTQNKS